MRAQTWLPETCGYRRVAEGMPLPEWHHLICGDREEVHRRGISKRGQLIEDTEVFTWLACGSPDGKCPDIRYYDPEDGTEIPVTKDRST